MRWPCLGHGGNAQSFSSRSTPPNHSLPDQHQNWADLKAAYRFLNNPKVAPAEIQRSHREQLQADCATRDRILSIQDGSELDFTHHPSVQDLGFVGDGIGQGLLQHSSLATTTEGQVLGVLHQVWWKRVETPPGETRRQRQARPTESGLWADSIRAVDALDLTPRVIHVMDRGGDCFGTMQAAFRDGAEITSRLGWPRKCPGSTLWSQAGLALSPMAPQPARTEFGKLFRTRSLRPFLLFVFRAAGLKPARFLGTARTFQRRKPGTQKRKML